MTIRGGIVFALADCFELLEPWSSDVLFYGAEVPWMPLDRLAAELERRVSRLRVRVHRPGVVHATAVVASNVVLMEEVIVGPFACIEGPTILGPRSVVRHGAYIRGHVMTGKDCVIGHATEIVRSILLDGAHASHFNYVGDSILGRGVNLGAGAKLANLKLRRTSVRVDGADTGRRKLGAILGDGVQLGCNVVCSPGTILAKGTSILPNVTVPPGCHSGSHLQFRE